MMANKKQLELPLEAHAEQERVKQQLTVVVNRVLEQNMSLCCDTADERRRLTKHIIVAVVAHLFGVDHGP